MSANEAYRIAKEIYAELGVDTEAAMARVAEIPVSMHCWQGDDVRGFENPDGDLTGGIQTTGNYPGRAKTIEQLRADFEKAASLIPGRKNINLHAIYLDNCGEHVDRDEITPKHFESWVKWAKENGFGIDFNPTYFSHKNSADGFTLSHTDAGIRRFWIDHGKACRRIAEYIGKELGTTVMDNHWVPDGMKDIPVDRYAFRQRLMESYDEIFSGKIDRKYTIDSVEGAKKKVFGIGAGAPSARTSSISHTRRSTECRLRSTPVTITRPRSFQTRYPPHSSSSMISCSMFLALSDGTATMLLSSTTSSSISLRRFCGAALSVCSHRSRLLLMHPSTVLRHGSSVHAACRRLCSSQRSRLSKPCARMRILATIRPVSRFLKRSRPCRSRLYGICEGARRSVPRRKLARRCQGV